MEILSSQPIKVLNSFYLYEFLDEIHFIDFEYCGHNNVCYDIANHFCEYSGMVDYDPTKYPSREMQREWVRAYLQAFKKSSGNSTDLNPSELEEWLDEIQNFTLVRVTLYFCHFLIEILLLKLF